MSPQFNYFANTVLEFICLQETLLDSAWFRFFFPNNFSFVLFLHFFSDNFLLFCYCTGLNCTLDESVSTEITVTRQSLNGPVNISSFLLLYDEYSPLLSSPLLCEVRMLHNQMELAFVHVGLT